MNKQSLAQWLQYLETLHPSEMELGLERVARVAGALDLKKPQVPVLTVAGTNGKGTTVGVMEALLRGCGYRVGAFTSPHFLRFNERIRVSGEEASDEEIVAAFEAIEAARGETSLTYFEFANLAALAVFRDREVDYILLEVGLGGRLDSANMVDADVALISSIALDHQEWLGDSRGAIAKEKAGIMRPGRPVLIADPEPPPELRACAQETGAGPVYCLGAEFSCSGAADNWQGSISTGSGRLSLKAMQTPSLLPQNVVATAWVSSSASSNCNRRRRNASGRDACSGCKSPASTTCWTWPTTRPLFTSCWKISLQLLVMEGLLLYFPL